MQRIGDSERDAAVVALREHMAAGRLTIEEFDERMTSALQARTQLDLAALFEDLPCGAPSELGGAVMKPFEDARSVELPIAAGAVEPVESKLEAAKVVAVTAIWIAFLAGVIFGPIPWWLFWIPLIATGAITDDIGKRRRTNGHRELDG